MNKAQLFAVFVIVFMVASTVGFSILFGPQKEQASTEEVPPLLDSTVFKVKAEDVNSRVIQMLPAMRIAAGSEKVLASEIDAELYAIEGVKSVYSVIETGDGSFGGKVNYFADVQFYPNFSSEQIFDSIKEETTLLNPLALKYCLVELPKEVTFYTADESQRSLSFPQVLSDNITELIVSFETIPSDELLVELQAEIVANSLTKLQATMLENVSLRPEYKTAGLTAKIVELKPELSLSSTATFSQISDENAFRSELVSAGGITDANVSLSVSPALTLLADTNISEQQLIDLNAALSSLQPEQLSLSNDYLLYAVVEFNETTSLRQKIQEIESMLEELEILGVFVEESQGWLQAQLALASASSANAARALTALLNGNGIVDFELLQPVVLDTNTVFDANAVKSYDFNSEQILALVQPEHAVGDEVELTFDYTLIRGQLAEGFAIEKA